MFYYSVLSWAITTSIEIPGEEGQHPLIVELIPRLYLTYNNFPIKVGRFFDVSGTVS